MKDDVTKILPGQRYRIKGVALLIWEVLGVVRYPGEPLPHVRLVKVGSPYDFKTVSARVLQDKRFYVPAE